MNFCSIWLKYPLDTSRAMRLSTLQLLFCPQHRSLQMISFLSFAWTRGAKDASAHFKRQLATSIEPLRAMPSCQSHIVGGLPVPISWMQKLQFASCRWQYTLECVRFGVYTTPCMSIQITWQSLLALAHSVSACNWEYAFSALRW